MCYIDFISQKENVIYIICLPKCCVTLRNTYLLWSGLMHQDAGTLYLSLVDGKGGSIKPWSTHANSCMLTPVGIYIWFDLIPTLIRVVRITNLSHEIQTFIQDYMIVISIWFFYILVSYIWAFSGFKIVTVMWCMTSVFHWAKYTKVKASLKYRETVALTKLTTTKVSGINTTHFKILHALKVLPDTTGI